MYIALGMESSIIQVFFFLESAGFPSFLKTPDPDVLGSRIGALARGGVFSLGTWHLAKLGLPGGGFLDPRVHPQCHPHPQEIAGRLFLGGGGIGRVPLDFHDIFIPFN